MDAEPGAADEIIARCARLPLALALVAARAATHPNFTLAGLADELRDRAGGLDAFEGGDPSTDLRSVISWSYQILGPDAAGLFRLLGLHPGPTFGAPAAASLAAIPVRAVRSLLAELTRVHLLNERLRDALDAGPAAHGWTEDQRWTLARVATVIGRLFHTRYTLRGVCFCCTASVTARRSGTCGRSSATRPRWRHGGGRRGRGENRSRGPGRVDLFRG